MSLSLAIDTAFLRLVIDWPLPTTIFFAETEKKQRRLIIVNNFFIHHSDLLNISFQFMIPPFAESFIFEASCCETNAAAWPPIGVFNSGLTRIKALLTSMKSFCFSKLM